MADDGTQKALIENVKELVDVDDKKSAAMARSRALDLTVAQGVRQAQLHQQQVAQPKQPSLVCWERFLPQQQLRVLLVEDNDSTGHAVTALLRNCGYEVTLVLNGQSAWALLMDQSSKVDLVLTEVVMPGLSGIDLLSQIMNHEPLKHIPVIMMSSVDSMGVVFKCLSQGAVDFLVKPVRKNELKNLWQHVWRRCHSSSRSRSGSGGGSECQRQKVLQPDTAGDSNIISGSDDERNSIDSALNFEGGSDNGSGNQSSWTKKDEEVESSHQGNAGSARLHSSIQSKNGCLLRLEQQKGKDDGLSMELNQADARVAAVKQPFFCNDQANLSLAPEMVRMLASNTKDTGQMEKRNEVLVKEQESAAEHQADVEDADHLLENHAKISSDSGSPLLKLSLKRPLEAENDGECEIRGTLKRSHSSAFSRYSNSGKNTRLPAAGTVSAKMNWSVNTIGDPSFARCSSVGSSHPSSMPLSSWTNRPSTIICTDEAIASPYFNGILLAGVDQTCSLAHTALSGKQISGPCLLKEENTGAGVHVPFYRSPRMKNAFDSCKETFSADTNLPPHWARSSENVEVQELHLPQRHIEDRHDTQANCNSEDYYHFRHRHHHVHHYHHHQDQSQQKQQTPHSEDMSVMYVGVLAPKCGSSNMEKEAEDNNGQSGSCNGYGSSGNGAVSLNVSATGSNGGRSAAAPKAAGVGNVDYSTQTGFGSGLTVVQDVLLAPDENWHAMREAALTKFRQKRKERCFEKKVRYQSRKRLAEQRPRVRGQFVKQSLR